MNYWSFSRTAQPLELKVAIVGCYILLWSSNWKAGRGREARLTFSKRVPFTHTLQLAGSGWHCGTQAVQKEERSDRDRTYFTAHAWELKSQELAESCGGAAVSPPKKRGSENI